MIATYKPTRREVRAKELQDRLKADPFRGFPRRKPEGLDTFYSHAKCERKDCEKPVGITSLGQHKRFHSKDCRRRRHNRTA